MINKNFVIVYFTILWISVLSADIELWQAFSSNIHNTDQNVKKQPFNLHGKVTADKKIVSVSIKLFAYETEKRNIPLTIFHSNQNTEAVFMGKVTMEAGENYFEIVANLEGGGVLSKRMPMYYYQCIDNTKIKEYTTLPSKQIHKDAVRSMVFSRDNRYLVSGSDDGYVRILEAKTLRIIHELRGHSGYVRAVAITHDNKYVLSGGSDGTLRIWDTKTGKKIQVIQAHKHTINAIALSNNGKYAVTCADLSLISLWNIPSFTKILDYGDCDSTLNYLCAEFTSDDRYVLAGDSDGVTTMFIATTGESETDEENDAEVVSVVMSRDMRHSFSADIGGGVTYRKVLLNPHVDDPVWLTEKDLWWNDLIVKAITQLSASSSSSTYGKIRDNHPVKGLSPRLVYIGLTGNGQFLAMITSRGRLKIREVHTGFNKFSRDLYAETTSGAISYDGKLCAIGELDGKIHLFGLP